jgi:predicted amidohydrolase
MENITVAIVQSASFKGDVEANVLHHLKFIETASGHGARMVLFPEMSLTGYEPRLAEGLALSDSDERLTPFRETARRLGIVIVAGAPIVSSSGGPHIGSVCVFPDGLTMVYRKQFLHPGEETFFSPGSKDGLFTLSGEKVALAICADISNPIHARNAADAGASMYAASVLIPETGYSKDTRLLRQYASEHRMAVLMANHSGTTGGYASAGKSAAWDETGQLISALLGAEEAVLVATREKGKWNSKTVKP